MLPLGTVLSAQFIHKVAATRLPYFRDILPTDKSLCYNRSLPWYDPSDKIIVILRYKEDGPWLRYAEHKENSSSG